MTATTQRYMPASTYGPANMFAPPTSHDLTKSNEYVKMFGNGAPNSRTIQPQQTQKQASRGSNLGQLNTDESSFFDFEPPSNTGSPFPNGGFSTPGAAGMPWGADLNGFHPLSPPDSAIFSPKDWPYEHGYQQAAPANILTNIDPANTRAQYGQVTPPDDDDDNESLLGLYEGQHMQPMEGISTGRKRKRNTFAANEQTSQSPKRARKYASRGGPNTSELTKPEDVKRSKFLERNRVAASKCRQKKKEWTQNLENRARELQKNNNSLRMMVESLRQEILFLKGELLKHNSCGCEHIQEFLKSGGNNFSDFRDDDIVFKREQSPIQSMPVSRAGSVGAASGRGLDDVDPASPVVEPSNTSIADDENALEALLSESINHDTSDEAIASQVAG